MLVLIFLVSTACLVQHHNMMVHNGMTRYKNDLVRRKDKVKARKADAKTPIKYKILTHWNFSVSCFLFQDEQLHLS